ncbi:MAG TPA: hypothetical protein DCY93_02005 [Firmicutes bacterium]|nr:hypothetical protein [Bacillota bacterium]
MASDRIKKSKRTEIVLLVIFGCLWLLGLILGILGIIAFNLPKLTSDNPLYSAQVNLAQKLHMGNLIDFRILGTIILIIATLFIVIVLQHYAHKYDEIKAKTQRREERRRNLLKEIQANQEKAATQNEAPIN